MCHVMFQAVIVPCGITAQMSADDRKQLIGRCEELSTSLRAAGILVKDDFRDNYSPGWKFNHWELKVFSGLNILVLSCVFYVLCVCIAATVAELTFFSG